MVNISDYNNLKLMPILEFLRLSRLAGLLGRGLESMLTDVSASLSEAIISVGNSWHGVNPVSYTHLDVYKRQFLDS